MLYFFTQGCRQCKNENKNVKPGFRNLQCETSDYEYTGLVVG